MRLQVSIVTPCGSKERKSGYRLEIFIDENPIDEFLPLSLQRDILSIDIDNLMREFQPCIKHDRYKASCASLPQLTTGGQSSRTLCTPGPLCTGCL